MHLSLSLSIDGQASFGSSPNLLNGLFAWFNDATGTDRSGNGNNLTPGDIGFSVGYIQIPAGVVGLSGTWPAPFGTSIDPPYTAACIITDVNLQGGDIFSFWNTTTLYGNVEAFPPIIPQFSADGGQDSDQITGEAIVTADPQSLIFIFDGTTQFIYQNGTLQDSRPAFESVGIGAAVSLLDASASTTNCSANNIGFWTRVLNAAEIALIAAGTDPTI